jgi:hypothetical protein
VIRYNLLLSSSTADKLSMVSKVKLLRLYFIERLTQRQVGAILGVSQAVVSKWLQHYGVRSWRQQGKAKAVLCDWCKKPVVKHRCRLRQKTHFCNMKCYGKYKAKHHVGQNAAHWQGGRKSHPRGASWTIALVRKVRKRDDHTCQRCSKTERELDRKLDVHHICPFRLFGIKRHREANRVSNLISYCHRCHMIVERRCRRRRSQL